MYYSFFNGIATHAGNSRGQPDMPGLSNSASNGVKSYRLREQ